MLFQTKLVWRGESPFFIVDYVDYSYRVSTIMTVFDDARTLIKKNQKSDSKCKLYEHSIAANWTLEKIN